VEMTTVESHNPMSLKEENNLWKCQHFPMEWEQINKISIKSIILGILFLNSISKQARMK
jgi:hypothetical protein